MYSAGQNPLQIGSKIQGYEIVRVIGAGGFGIVYEGYNSVIKRRAAIKEFFPAGYATREGATSLISVGGQHQGIYDKVLKKFRDTTGYLAELDHPNIVKVHGYDDTGENSYMLMDYVEGDTVREWRNNPQRKFNGAKFRSVFKQIFDALIYLHSKGMYHRDLSPENILIDKDNNPIIIDFGAVRQELRDQKAQDKTGITSTIPVAREDYAPVEQLQLFPSPIGAYTDVFTLAITMYELLCNERPPKAGERMGEKQFSGKDPYIPIAQKSKIKLKDAEFQAIDKAAKFRPDERFQSIEEFAAAAGWADSETIPIPPPPPPPQPPSPPYKPPAEYQPEHGGSKKKSRGLQYALIGLIAIIVVGVLVVMGQNTDPSRSETKGGKTVVAKTEEAEQVGPKPKPVPVVTIKPGPTVSTEPVVPVDAICSDKGALDNIVVSRGEERLRNFINSCEPNGKYLSHAKDAQLAWNTDHRAWEAVKNSTNPDIVQRKYIDRFSNGLHLTEAIVLHEELVHRQNEFQGEIEIEFKLYQSVIDSDDPRVLNQYPEKYPTGKYASVVNEKIQKILNAQSKFCNAEFTTRANLDTSAKSVINRYLSALGSRDVDTMLSMRLNPSSRTRKIIESNKNESPGRVYASRNDINNTNYNADPRLVSLNVDAFIFVKTFPLIIELQCSGKDWKITRWAPRK